MAQPQLTGLPKYGVLLEGAVSAPVIVNHSGHSILAYTLVWVAPNGARMPYTKSVVGQLRNSSAAGIPTNSSQAHHAGVEQRDSNGQPLLAGFDRVLLDSVLLDDGRLLGPDTAGGGDLLAGSIAAERYVHGLLSAADGKTGGAQAQAWATIHAIANGQLPAPAGSAHYQRAYARQAKEMAAELVRVREKQGDRGAFNLARSSQNYPQVRKGE